MDKGSEDAFEEKSDSFLAWFQGQPGAHFHPDLRIADLRSRNAGRGIIASADIPADTELFSIPRSSIITTENSSLHRRLPEIFLSKTEPADADASDDGEEFDPWLKLIVTLLYEHLRGAASPWKPYLDVLPTSFETLMFWSDDELRELQASAVRDKIGKAGADTMFRDILLPLVRKHENAFFPDSTYRSSEEEIIALAHRMGSTIMAYAFDLEKDDAEADDDGWVEDREGQTLGMVPMADMLNADAEFNAHLNHGDSSLTMTSLRPIAAGEEVLNYYGPLPNSDLLRRYGYITAKHRLHDVVEISWDLVLKVAKRVLHLDDGTFEAIVEQLDPDALEDTFVLERDPVEPDSSGLLHPRERSITTLPEELSAQIKTLIKAAKRTKPETVSEPDRTVLSIISECLTARLGEYHTSVEEDEALLEDAQGRRRMAIEVRLEEKRILRQMREFVDRLLLKEPGEQERKVKRQKLA